eukprot:scaffold186302_cov23-Tisochrysis_lutea.AAC.1
MSRPVQTGIVPEGQEERAGSLHAKKGCPLYVQHVCVSGQAFYARARLLHPDKGGSSAAFARCQEAMHILGDSRSRQ